MEIKLFNNDIETLRPIAESWFEFAKKNKFGIEGNVDKHLLELGMMAVKDDADLIVLYDEDTPVGYIGLIYFISPLSEQKIAEEHYFYVVPEKRGLDSMRLIKSAKYLAGYKGCSHIIFNASNLASDLHDKVCSFYEKQGMKLFETSYIMSLTT